MRLGDMLVKAGLIDEMQLRTALAKQRLWGGKLGDIVQDLEFVSEMMIWKGLSHQLSLALVSVPDQEIPPAVVRSVPALLCAKYDVFPIKLDGKTVTLATSEPSRLDDVDQVAFQTGLRIKLVLAPPREIQWAIGHYHHGLEDPCPPPRTIAERTSDGFVLVRRGGEEARIDSAVPQPAATAAAHLSASPNTPMAHLAGGTAQPMTAPPLTVQPATGQPATVPPSALDPVAEATARLRNTTQSLRLLVDTCIERGFFTRDEYVARVRTLGG